MSSSRLCVHLLDDPVIRSLADYEIAAETHDRQSLRTALGIEPVDALIIDLDHADAFDTIVEALEIKQGLAVVGVTGTNDVNKCIMAQRAGCRQLTSKPIDENDLLVALRRALNESSEPPPMGKTLSVIGSSGGAGATTLACHLAMTISEFSPSVGIIDADFELGTVAQSWDLSPRYTISDLVDRTSIHQQDVEDIMLELPSGICVLPRPDRIEQATTIDETTMKKVIEATMAAYPFVVLDLPRKLDPIAGCVIEASDKLLIVAQLTVPGIVNTGRMADALCRWEVPTDKVEFVVNRYNGKFHSVDVATLEDRVGKKVIGVIPNHYKSLSAAADLGQPVSQGNPVRKAIADIAAILCGNHNKPVSSSPSWISNLGFGRS